MCGICGIAFRNPEKQVDAEVLHRMNNLLAHRGPDGSGVWTDGNIGLAHRRLSLIDLSDNGRQPMVDQPTGSVLTYNGEVYNFRKLKDEFFKEVDFKSRTDSEVILKLMAAQGETAVDLLEGMFAFAFFDRPNNQLILARDAFGIKPLYYSIQSGFVTFGSELKAIMASGLISRELDREALNDFFDFTFIPAPRSIYRNIKKLEPGHLIKIDLTNWTVTSRCYWEPQYTPELGRSTSRIIEETNDALRQSVKQQLVADVPVGSFLSGGIDSTLVTSAAAQQSDTLSAFTVDFDSAKFSEASQAEDLAKQMGIQNHWCTKTGPQGLDLVNQLAWFFDEPFADSSMIPAYLVCEFARQHNKVCLSGDGGDELFSGYAHHRVARKIDRWGRVPDWLSQSFFGVTGRLGSSNPWIYEWSRRLALGRDRRLLSLARLPGNKNRLSLLGSTYRSDQQSRFWIVEQFVERLAGLPPVTRAQLFDIYFYLPGDMLAKVDRSSMANSLEVRVPFLSKSLANFALSIPEEQRFQNNELKYVLRQLVGRQFGTDHGTRRKQGFSIPLVQWLQQSGLVEIRRRLLDSEPIKNQVLDHAAVERQFREFETYKNNPFRQNRTATNIFSLLTFVAWWDNHYAA